MIGYIFLNSMIIAWRVDVPNYLWKISATIERVYKYHKSLKKIQSQESLYSTLIILILKWAQTYVNKL